jgi:hypothetical protein
MDTTFHHLYEYEQLAEIPGREVSPHFYYPGASSGGGRDGLIVRIQSCGGAPWLATFAFGQSSARGVRTGILTTPDPQRLCVIARGGGYFVNANDPTSWERVQAQPIIDVRQIAKQQMIVFADFTRLVAYGPEGKKWKSDRLGWDGVRITDVTDKVIKGETTDPMNGDKVVSFVIDLFTGMRGEEDEAKDNL